MIKQNQKSILILVVVLLALLGLFWLANSLGGGESVQSERPRVICQPPDAPPEQQQCFWTAHIHATVRVFKGTEEIPIGFEQGELEEEHTHAEKNKLHWHGLLPADPVTKEAKDMSALQVGTIPDDLKLSVDGQPTFVVNGVEVEPTYIWKDGDDIEIRYG